MSQPNLASAAALGAAKACGSARRALRQTATPKAGPLRAALRDHQKNNENGRAA
jgi:hypothetical protein